MGTLLKLHPNQLSADNCRLLLDSVQDYAVFMLDPEGRVASWTRGAERIKGYRAEEILGQHVSVFYPPPAADESGRELELVVKVGRVESEGWRVRKDGSFLWAHVVLTAIRDDDGELRGFASVTRDLTAQHTAEDALVRSEERFRLLTDAVQDYAIYMLDLRGHVTTWNEGAERIKGYAPSEILGRHYSVFFPQEDVAASAPERELAEALARGRFEQEGYRIRKDGTRFWASVVLTPIRSERGKVIGFAKVTRDLSVRRAAEEALRRSEERLRLLVEAVSDYAIYMLDPQGNVSTWNTGAERIKGYSPEEILGRNYALFFPPEDLAARKPQEELELAERTGHFEQEGYRVRKDGTRFWASVVLTPVRDERGTLLGFAKVTRDLTAHRKAEQVARELLREQTARAAAQEAEAQLRASERRYRALSERLHLILNGVVDGITVVDRTGKLTFANTAALRMGSITSTEELAQAIAQGDQGRYELFDERGARVSRSELPVHRVLGGMPAASMLLHVHDRVAERHYWCEVRASAVPGDSEDSGLAVAVWHDVTEHRRREQHDKYLADATATLAESLDYEASLSSLAGQLVPGLGDFCVIHLLEGEALVEVAVAHSAPEEARRAHEYSRKYPPDPSSERGVWNVLRTGTHELFAGITDDMLGAFARSEEQLEFLRATGLKAVLIVPMVVRQRVIGTLTLISVRTGERYDAGELSLALEIARRAGNAVENARAYAAERAARDRLELLAQVGESLSTASDYEDVLRRVVHNTLPALGDFAFFDLLEGTSVRRIAAAHQDAELDAALKQTSWARSERTDKNLCALSTGASGYHPQIDDAWLSDVASGPEHLAVLRASQLCSMVTVPLEARGELLGSLTLCFGRSGRHHSPDDLRLAEELARRATIAVERARLYAESQAAARAAEQAARRAEEAARRAEQANRLKDEFLATVSHELRTPLNAILGWASLIRGRAEPSLAKAVEIIHRNAHAQAKIIDDILDVSRIITGKLRLELKPVDLQAIVHDALEVIRPSADAKSIALEFTESGEACLMVGDPQRLQQIVWNLLSNAVKFTDRNGTVRVAVERQGSRFIITVSDTGKGIEPDFLPYVFERFRQADSATTRRYGGLGLGLSIVRHLVELHGGEVQASSPGKGQGATFTIALPVRAVAPSVHEPDARPQPEAPPAGARVLLGTRVLVVDDEPDARELVQSVLLDAGASVETAASAEEAFIAVQRFLPDVLVSDIGMPEEDGYSLMQRIRSLDPAFGGKVLSVALTAYARRQDKAKALAMGFTTHVAKPVDPAELIASVSNLAFARK